MFDMVYLVVLCSTLFFNSYYSVKIRHLSYGDDIENFELFLGNRRARRAFKGGENVQGHPVCNQGGNGGGWGEGKPKLIYMV